MCDIKVFHTEPVKCEGQSLWLSHLLTSPVSVEELLSSLYSSVNHPSQSDILCWLIGALIGRIKRCYTPFKLATCWSSPVCFPDNSTEVLALLKISYRRRGSVGQLFQLPYHDRRSVSPHRHHVWAFIGPLHSPLSGNQTTSTCWEHTRPPRRQWRTRGNDYWTQADPHRLASTCQHNS